MKETVIVIGYETSYLEYKIKSLGYNVFPINYFSKKNLWKNLNITTVSYTHLTLPTRTRV